jgi:hypothetical protein
MNHDIEGDIGEERRTRFFGRCISGLESPIGRTNHEVREICELVSRIHMPP